MIFKNDAQIVNIIKFAPPVFIFTVMIIILSFLFIEKNKTFENEKKQIALHYEAQNKQLIKDQVNSVYDFILREQKSTEDELKASLKQALNNAYVIAQTIYKNNPDKSKEQIQKLIKDALVNIRFNEGRGYFFIYDKNGVNIMHPILPHVEGKNMMGHQDTKGKFPIADMISLLKEQNEAFDEWHWQKPGDLGNEKRKIGYFKTFEPFNWFIGTGEYVKDFEKQVQEKVLKHIREIRYGETGYIFVINYDSIYLSHIRRNFIGQNAITNNDTVGIKKVIKDLIEISKSGDGYYSYVQNMKPGIDAPTTKISYVKGLNNWSWMIGTGYYEDDLNAMINEKRMEFQEKFETYLVNTITTALFITMILLLISIYISKKLQEKFENYKKEIDVHLEKNEKQQSILSHQSKMAAMGEMIGNIAHQWRQPLSTISTTATGIQIQKEMNILEDKLLDEGLETINKSAQHLSATIDDFRNFFSITKNRVTVHLDSTLNKAINLISVQFHNKDIEIIKNIHDVTLETYENELIQVIINILNNARDELSKMSSSELKYIFIDVFHENDQAVITIKDNAGGIPEDIVLRIFEPYFTTKHQSQGTGIGLYMSQEIIQKNIGGTLTATNVTYEYKEITYKGALFKITLPKTLK